MLLSEHAIIVDRMRELVRLIRRNNITDEFDPLCCEYRQLMKRAWETPIKWSADRDPSTRNERFRIRGTQAERVANRLMFGR